MALLDLLTRPPRLPRAVDRPRLRHLLLDGIEPGQLVVAPPGSGKTVAAAQLLDAARTSGGDGRRTGWCRLTPGAGGGDDLVRLIGAALGTAVDDPGVGPLERASTVLDLLGDEPVVLVVDDYELARPEECDAVLAEVLGLVPPDCRLVVCSALRPAGLVGRASVGQLAVVGPGELAFTEDEVARLLVLLGHDPAPAAALRRDSAGWATAVAVLAEGAGRSGRDLSTALEAILDRAGAAADPSVAEVLGVLAVVPALSGTEAETAGLDAAVLADMAAATALLRPVGDGWALLDVMREPVRRRIGAERLGLAAARIAPVLAARDPLAAAAMLLDAGDDGAAADILTGHASAMTAEAVVPLLYRMRPEVRRRLPPVLSGARATVEMDTALAGAEQRVQATGDPREKAEAQIAVGTILLHRGQLASAAAALEAALRLLGPLPDRPGGLPTEVSGSPLLDQVAPTGGRSGDAAVVAVATGWLGLARLWAGDLDGAAAAIAPVSRAEPTHGVWSLARWAAAEIALARHALAGPPASPTSPASPDRATPPAQAAPTIAAPGHPGPGAGASPIPAGEGGHDAGLHGQPRPAAGLSPAPGVEGGEGAGVHGRPGPGSAGSTVPAGEGGRGAGGHRQPSAGAAPRLPTAFGDHDAGAHGESSAEVGASSARATAGDRPGATPHGRTSAWPAAGGGMEPAGQGVLERVGVLVGELRAGGWAVAADAVAARLALAHGAETAAADQAAAAYRGAAAAGGLDLLVAGPPHAWCLARAGRWDEAGAVADELRRRLGVVDTCARLHADLIAEAGARATGDAVGLARRSRDIAAARRMGFAPVEAVARRWLPAAPADGGSIDPVADDRGLVVQLLGPVVVTVDGRRIDDRTWRSRKAREVLVVLALAAEAGRRRDEVIEAVWPERDPAKGRSLLRTALADIRRILEPGRPPGEPSRFLASQGDRLTLAARTDLAAAERHRAAGGAGALAAAWTSFRGELVADDPYADSLADARRAAEQLRAELAEALVATGLSDPASGSTEALVDAAAFLHEREPWRTDLVGPVAVACRAAGDELAAARAERLLGPPGPPD